MQAYVTNSKKYVDFSSNTATRFSYYSYIFQFGFNPPSCWCLPSQLYYQDMPREYNPKFYVSLTVHLDITVYRKINFMHTLFLVYFINLYMYQGYLGPSSGGTTVCIQHLVFTIPFRWLSVVLFNPTRTTDSHLKRIISTNCCIRMVVPLEDGPRYAWNM